ncbi:hypothetical protein JY96_20460 [Aquabacterium sp. NJ1]|uniref:hypothetical protein n=1 Tax=Aquabacterium sp. NJ1 TaxID=1538295 RepID=UPI00052BD068|nr:hypothetical protein [Aquabacterium sp. NJ1]KGM41634.1 hypothetical protein JY96_20460 [Aquabacterium sp. NJ1]
MKNPALFAPRNVIISKTIVGLSWVLGLAELAHPYMHMPPSWLYVVMALSLLAHAAQCAYFVRKFGATATPLWSHLLQIMVFGMPHIIGFQQSLSQSPRQAVST